MTNNPGYAELAIKNTYENSDPIGTKYNYFINGELTNELNINGQTPHLELIGKSPNNLNSGYQGYLYKNIDTGEYYVVHGGSQTLEITPEYNVLSRILSRSYKRLFK